MIYLQFTISSTKAVLFATKLLATRVKLFVSVHKAFFMMKVVIFTENSVIKYSEPLYQDTFDKGLLSIKRLNMTLSLSFTVVLACSIMVGLSEKKIQCL